MPLKILTPLFYLCLSPLSFSCLCPFLSSFSFLGPFYFHFYHLACWKSEQYSWYNTKTLWAEKCGVIQAKVSPLLFFFLFLLFFWFSIGKKQCLHHINKSRSDFHSYSLFSSLGKNSELCIQRHTPMFRDQKSGLLMEGSTKNRHIPR